MIRKILLATDGSAPAERATDFVASLALRYKTCVTVLHAFTPVPATSGEQINNRLFYETLDEARSLVEKAAQRLKDLGIKQVAIDVIEGPPANVILGVAESSSIDLIVLGARGLGTWQGVVLGSVSMSVTQRSECPVLVVK